MNRRLAKALLIGMERVRGERLTVYLRELEESQRQTPEVRGARNDALLRSLLQTAARENPFYQRRFEGSDVASELSKFAILKKADLRTHYREIVTPRFRSKVELCKTSGSTGEPLKFYRDRVVFGYTLASVYRAQRWYGLDLGSKYAMLWGIPGTTHARLTVRLKDALLNRFRESEYDLSVPVLTRFYRDVRARRPEFLFGYSSMVYEFALFISASGFDGRALGLKAAICTAEVIHDHHRALIEHTFACPVVSEYGSAETGIISYQCPRGSHHVSDDCVRLELLGDDDREVGDGEVGRVVVTVLHSHCAPVIRYELGDYAVRRPGECGCGVKLPMLQRIIGRTSGVIVTPSGVCYHSIAVYYIMKDFAVRFGGVRQFRVVQTEIARLEFHVAAEQAFTDEAERWLAEAIRRRFGAEMHVDFFRHDRLDRGASGKLTDFESRLDEEQRLLASFKRPRFPDTP